MNHSIEQINGDWQGAFHRINIDGKRKIMIFSSVLYQLLGIQYPKHRDWLSSILLRTGLRDAIDYQHGRNNKTGEADTHLSIGSVQALLVIVNSDQSWELHNQLSDLINRGFSNEPKDDTSRGAVPAAPTHTSRQFQPSTIRSSNGTHRNKRR